jgi:hypothetical protein
VLKCLPIFLLAVGVPTHAQTTSSTHCNTFGGTLNCQTTTQTQPAAPAGSTPQSFDANQAIQAYRQGREDRVSRENQIHQDFSSLNSIEKASGANAKLPFERPSPSDIFIGCSLLVEGTDIPRRSDGSAQRMSAMMCEALAYGNLARKPHDTPAGLHVCIPSFIKDKKHEMAVAYIEGFNKDPKYLLNSAIDGPTAYTVFMVMRWPCPDDKAPSSK